MPVWNDKLHSRLASLHHADVCRAKLVTLPEGLQAADLINPEVAERHGYKLAPPPPPPPVQEVRACGNVLWYLMLHQVVLFV
jgi:hypothetical protein